MTAGTDLVRIAAPATATATDAAAWFAQAAGGPLAAALDLDVSDLDELARPEAVHLTGLQADDGAVVIDYRVDACAFHACRDLHLAGRAHRRLRGRVDGTDWLFPVHRPPEARTPGDEL